MTFTIRPVGTLISVTELNSEFVTHTWARSAAMAGAVFHSDLGSQYLSGDYRGLRERLGLRQSAGRVGTCFDNSAAEKLLELAQARARPPLPLRHPRGGQASNHRLDQPLQRRQAAFQHRLRPTDRVGDQLPSSAASRIRKRPDCGGNLTPAPIELQEAIQTLERTVHDYASRARLQRAT
jgi:transposase InsO family protein